MFQRLDNKTIRGPNFVLSVPDIHRAVYTEGEMVASVEIEGGMGPDNQVNWLVYSETLRGWQEPHADIDMAEAKRQEVLKTVSASLDLLAMPHKVV